MAMDNSTYSQQFADGEVHENKPKLMLGTIGAIVGAALGSVLWVVIFYFGYVASIAGIAIIFCAYKGYTLLSKQKGKIGAIIATIVSVIMLCIAHYFAWGLDIHRAFSPDYDITLWDALMSTHVFIFDPEYLFDFFKDLIIGFLLIGVGFFYYVRADMKKTALTAASTAETTDTTYYDTPSL